MRFRKVNRCMQSRGLFGKKYLDIQERERDIPAAGANHVLVKIHACGVCGTDINFVRDWADQPMPLGHEISAEVIEVGTNVTHVQPGDRVIVEDCTMCGVCADCKSGQPQFCRNMFDLEGQPGMGQYMSRALQQPRQVRGPGSRVGVPDRTAGRVAHVRDQCADSVGGQRGRAGPGPAGIDVGPRGETVRRGLRGHHGTRRPTRRANVRGWPWRSSSAATTVFEAGRQDLQAEIKRQFPQGRRPRDRLVAAREPGRRTAASSSSGASSPSTACISAAAAKWRSTSTT